MLNRVVLNKFAIGASIILSAGLALSVFAADPAKPKKEGYTDTPMEPGGKWHVHDPDRPNPRIITPAQSGTQDKAGTAPSDAIVLFDGKDTSHWQSTENGQAVAPKWKVEAGYMVAEKNAGSIFSKESFGDIQLHVEWSSPTPARGDGQGRGNSGVIIMRSYEIQVLDSYDNVTYADGQAGAIYGQYPPLVNACRKPGECRATTSSSRPRSSTRTRSSSSPRTPPCSTTACSSTTTRRSSGQWLTRNWPRIPGTSPNCR